MVTSAIEIYLIEIKKFSCWRSTSDGCSATVPTYYTDVRFMGRYSNLVHETMFCFDIYASVLTI